MVGTGSTLEFDPQAAYARAAIYYEDADAVEYVRRDGSTYSDRVDENLTLVYAATGDELIGFRLKGFKNMYLRDRAHHLRLGIDFYSLVGALERTVESIASDVINNPERRDAYRRAWQIALADSVALRDLPRVAA